MERWQGGLEQPVEQEEGQLDDCSSDDKEEEDQMIDKHWKDVNKEKDLDHAKLLNRGSKRA